MLETTVRNSAGGSCFALDDWKRLERFLILGSEGGTYYVSERALTEENAGVVLRCLKANGPEAVRRIAAVSDSGRAVRNDAAVFALALAASRGDELTRRAAYQAVGTVCRTGTHLFAFADACNRARGWGRGLRKAVAAWYTGMPPRELAYQVTKYRQREGWSHRDLLRLAHPAAAGTTNDVLHYVTRGWDWVGETPHDNPDLLPIWAAERAARATSEEEICRLIRDHNLVRECVPTRFLNSAAVWDALLVGMPVTAMLRNLGKMAAVGLLTPLSAASRTVSERLTEPTRLKNGRVHPMSLLVALKVYAQGRGVRGSLTWQPAQQVLTALDRAFYLAFDAVTPTGKRHYLGVDVSGSMSAAVAGTPLSAREAAAALALVTAATEPSCEVMGFTRTMTRLDVTPSMRLSDALRVTSGLPFGGTDCAQPMLHALKAGIEADVFVVLTDSETWAGHVKPDVALRLYREKTGIPAKLVVVGMTSNGFSIADPDDAGMLDVVGFSPDVPSVLSGFVCQ